MRAYKRRRERREIILLIITTITTIIVEVVIVVAKIVIVDAQIGERTVRTEENVRNETTSKRKFERRFDGSHERGETH